jgi:DNA polymerase-3 subunit alpha (Gram-positive type)
MIKSKGSDFIWARRSEKYSRGDLNHIIIFAKNKEGLLSLYGLISKSHVENFYYKPRIKRSWINEARRNLIIGSACEQGELFKSILNNASEAEIEALRRSMIYLGDPAYRQQ